MKTIYLRHSLLVLSLLFAAAPFAVADKPVVLQNRAFSTIHTVCRALSVRPKVVGISDPSVFSELQSPTTSDWHSQRAVGSSTPLRPTPSDPEPSVPDRSSLAPATRSSASNWFTETIDRGVVAHTYTSLTLNENSRPSVSYAYQSHPSSSLRYAYYDGAAWQIETVYEENMYDTEIGASSLALDQAGQPHVAYSEFYYFPHWPFINYTLSYALHDGSGWRRKRIGTGTCPSLALDPSDQPHVSYLVPPINYLPNLIYAWHDGGTWHFDTVDTGWVTCSSLTLDITGIPHISYGSDGLKYALWTGSTWNIQTVDDANVNVAYTSLALDGAGNPHISYYAGAPDFDLRYARWKDGAWQIETVDSIGETGSFNSLALDAADRPHISYYDQTSGDLKFARRGVATWHIETVDSMGNVGLYSSLALDTSGRPHISYYDETNGDLKYAHRLPLILDKQALPSNNVRANEALTYSVTLTGPGLTVQLRDPLPANVHYIPGTITGTVAPPANYSPTLRAIIWHGVLATNTLQTIRFQVTPGITGTGSLSLSLPIINTAWLTDTAHQRTVSDTVIVNGLRFYLPVAVRQD